MKTAIVFPGQGSQSVGMMAGFASLPVVKATFEEASAILGEDYWALAEAGPAEAQNRTVVTQPLMLIAGVACWPWRGRAGDAGLLRGHSLGSTGAHCRRRLTSRGASARAPAAGAVQEAVPKERGIAAIVGLPTTGSRRFAEARRVLEPATLNSPARSSSRAPRAVEHCMAAARRGAKIAGSSPWARAPASCGRRPRGCRRAAPPERGAARRAHPAGRSNALPPRAGWRRAPPSGAGVTRIECAPARCSPGSWRTSTA
jgi:[acyl-carrier-protein] S-malonyltransferase